VVGSNESAHENRALALAGAHAEGVPVVLLVNPGRLVEARGRPVEKGPDDTWVFGRGVVTAECAEPGPDRGERGENLGAGEPVAAGDLGAGIRRGIEEHKIIARFADAEGENLALAGLAQEKVEGVIATLVQGLRDAGPDEVHIDREGRGRGMGGQAGLQARRLGQAQPETAELGRHERAQVAGGDEVGEVLGAKGVGLVIAGRAGADASEQGGVELESGVGSGRKFSHMAKPKQPCAFL
jgi:hypothetical protein